ncbi:MAG: hypothetical protein AAF582_00200 [Pseudomonadota bacterium]
MIGWLISEFWPLIVGGAGVLWALLENRRAKKHKAENKSLKEMADRSKASDQAVRDGKQSGLSPEEQVRRNDGDWK